MFKKLTALLSLILLTACTNSESTTLKWISYKDINVQQQALSFTQIPNTSMEQKQGELLQRNNDTEKGFQSLGDIYAIALTTQQPLRVVLLNQQGQSVNPYQQTELQRLAQASQAELYEFSRGRISQTQFQAPQGLCQSFQTKQGVKIVASNNFYATPVQFITSFIQGNIRSHQVPSAVNYRTEFNIKDPQLFSKIKADEVQYAQQNALNFLAQQQSFLQKLVCGLK